MGTYDFKDIYSILFVCTGNMCRSPMAEGVFQSRVKAESGPWTEKILVQSCGTYAMDGNKPSQYAIQVARQHGIDISGIRSKSLNRVFVEQSDLILAMSIDHLNFILENYPTARQKTFLLKLFNKNRPITLSDSIPDPMGFSIEFYQKTFQEIRMAIDESYPHIMDRVHRKLNSTSH
jgi:protein-tyrosine-phosphatase